MVKKKEGRNRFSVVDLAEEQLNRAGLTEISPQGASAHTVEDIQSSTTQAE